MSPPASVLITGASRGIGRAIARALAAPGRTLVLTARDREGLEATKAECADGTEVHLVPTDLRDPTAPERILGALDTVPDVVVNNAGTAPSARLGATTDEDLALALDLHVAAPLRLLRAVLPTLVADDRPGVAVQIASTAGLRGFPFTSAYGAAKHGMVGLTRAVAEELARSPVRSYAVCPGFVDTDITRTAAARVASGGRSTAAEVLERMGAMNRIGRLHRPEEVAEAAAHLVLDRPEGCVYDLDRDPPGFV